MADGDAIDRMRLVRTEIDTIKIHLSRTCEPSRELSLALTKLDEARLWAHEAIAIPAYSTNGASHADPHG